MARGFNYQASRNNCPLRYWYFIEWFGCLDLPPENCLHSCRLSRSLVASRNPRRNNLGKTIAWAKREGYAIPPHVDTGWCLIFSMPYTTKSRDSPVMLRMWTGKRYSAEIHFLKRSLVVERSICAKNGWILYGHPYACEVFINHWLCEQHFCMAGWWSSPQPFIREMVCSLGFNTSIVLISQWKIPNSHLINSPLFLAM